VSPQSPLPLGEAWVAVARCIARSVELLAQRRIHMPRSHVGDQLYFADSTSARVRGPSAPDWRAIEEGGQLPASQRCRLVTSVRGTATRAAVVAETVTARRSARSSSTNAGSMIRE
jgi:hypothetical protein